MSTERFIAAIAVLIAVRVAHAGTTILVPLDYPTIQQAIVASVDGDTVLVAPGTYFEQLDFLDRQITVQSTDGPATTTIDASYFGPVVHFGSAATRQAVLRGFTITHGLGGVRAGGIEVLSGSPSIVGNIITGNAGGGVGNGVSLEASSALVLDNEITSNVNNGAFSGGGGGGGIGLDGTPCTDPGCGAEIRGNLIEANSADRYLEGGGIFVESGGALKIVDNIIRGNTAPTFGGGIAIIGNVDVDIENNLIVDNQLTDPASEGGGVYWLIAPASSNVPHLVGNTIANNRAVRGSGVYADGIDSNADIVNNMIVSIVGVTGLECGNFNNSIPPIVMTNDVYAIGAQPYAGLCLGDGGQNGNLSDEPVFEGVDDYRLNATSPGIDAGTNAAASEATDLSGSARILDGNQDGVSTIDIGAYELLVDEIFAGDFEH